MWPAPANSPATARSRNTRPRSGRRSRVRWQLMRTRCGIGRERPSRMTHFTPGRQAGPEGDADRSGPARTRVSRAPARPRTIPTSSSASAPAAIAARRCAARSPRRTSWPSPRRSASTAARRASTARSIMGKDTHALSGPAQRTALEVLAANGVRDDHPARRRRHADAGRSRTPSSSTTAGARTGSPTASSSRRRTTRRRTAASSTTRPTAARPTPTSPAGSRTAPTSCCAAATPGVKRVPLRRPR